MEQIIVSIVLLALCGVACWSAVSNSKSKKYGLVSISVTLAMMSLAAGIALWFV